MLADEFYSEILIPIYINEHLIPIRPARASYSSEENFTMVELRTALQMCQRRRAPGEDGITYQVLRSLHQPFHRRVLKLYSSV